MFSNVAWLRDVGVPHDVDEKREAPAKDSVLFVQLPTLRTVGQAGAWGNVTRSIPEVTDWLVIHVAEAHAVVVVFCPRKDVAMQLELLMPALRAYKRLQAQLWCCPQNTGCWR
jgi:hypothetical protein